MTTISKTKTESQFINKFPDNIFKPVQPISQKKIIKGDVKTFEQPSIPFLIRISSNNGYLPRAQTQRNLGFNLLNEDETFKISMIKLGKSIDFENKLKEKEKEIDLLDDIKEKVIENIKEENDPDFREENEGSISQDVEAKSDSENGDKFDEEELIRNSLQRRYTTEFLHTIYENGKSESTSDRDFEMQYYGNGKRELEKKIKNPEYFNNRYIYSKYTCHPFSFFYGNKTFCYQSKNKNMLKVPAPQLIASEDWMKKPELTKTALLKGLIITNDKGIVLVDEKIQRKMKGLVANMIKQILLAALGRKISLPVGIFQPKFLLQTVSLLFSFCNKYLIPANDPSLTPLERFKMIIAFGLSPLYLPSDQLKPFNPLLGETFQGELESGGKVYIEHVSHHPLVSRFYVTHPKYMITGFFEFIVKPEKFGTIIYVYHKGPITILLKDINEQYTFHTPIIKLVGATSEKGRGCYWSGNMNFVDLKHNYKAIVKFLENKNCVHEITGCIYDYKFPNNYKFTFDEEQKKGEQFQMKKINKLKIEGMISGSWLNKIYIDNKLYWDISVNFPEWIRPVKSCLPSDGRFREDLIWLYRSFYCAKDEKERALFQDISQEWKLLMEQFQRVERQLRIDNKKKMKKK